jgi:thiamine-phosphate pyrophosphorylase
MNLPARLRGLYVVTCDNPAKGRTHLDVARAAVETGAAAVQLRDKAASSRQLFHLAQEIRRITLGTATLFFVNDRVDIALAAGADGVHVGEEDLPVAKVRDLVGEELLIGASVNSVATAKAAAGAGADYLGAGSIFPTPSKADAGAPIGLEILRQIKAEVPLPLVAIGGITLENAPEVLAAGADGLAVISAISAAEDMVAAAVNLIRLFQSQV